MENTETARPANRLWVALAAYVATLSLACQLFAWAARYELLMQTLDTLWPVVAFTALLLLVLACALLLAWGAALWQVIGGQSFAVLWWLFLLPRGGENLLAEVVWQDSLKPFVLLATIALLPPLLGYALLRLRKRQLRKARQAAEQPLSFAQADSILEGATRNDATNGTRTDN